MNMPISSCPRMIGMIAASKRIHSKKYSIMVSGQEMNIFDAEKQGLIEVFYDKHIKTYSYIVKATGEVVSYFLGFHPESHPQWLKDHLQQQQQQKEAIK